MGVSRALARVPGRKPTLVSPLWGKARMGCRAQARLCGRGDAGARPPLVCVDISRSRKFPRARKPLWIPAFAGMTGLGSGNGGAGKRNWRGRNQE